MCIVGTIFMLRLSAIKSVFTTIILWYSNETKNYCEHRKERKQQRGVTSMLVMYMLIIERMTIIPCFLSKQQLSSLWDPKKEHSTGMGCFDWMCVKGHKKQCGRRQEKLLGDIFGKWAWCWSAVLYRVPPQGQYMPVFAGACLLLGADVYGELSNSNQNNGERVVV